ncbi:MAG: recombinase family protein [Clostridiales bacterium]|nr:recombinase family protein [Clostridiales bacterium]
MKKITKIEPQIPAIPARKKVAAYARVSVESERLHHSLSAQISYYSELIQKNPEWEYAGVYADEGITGTKTDRAEFQQMLADCEAGLIDIILTKSISRFARNTLDLLETVRHLKELGIEVWFEKENIHSLSGDGEVMLTLLASFAQEESISISNNVKWGIRKRMQEGIPNGHFRILGYRWKDDRLVVEPEEAAIVKRIFQNFLDGKSRLETERELEAEGIRSINGCVMRDSNIHHILTNVTYTGNLLLQKQYVADPISKHKKNNHGELPQYYVENTHEPIIDMETFQFVQDEMARRRELGPLANKALNTTCFTGKIKCPYCGVSYIHNQQPDKNPREYWMCGARKKVGGRCPVGGSIIQQKLIDACCDVLGLEEFDSAAFLEQIDIINVPERYKLEFHLKDGTITERDCTPTGHQDCWTPEYRARVSAQRRKTGTNPKGASCFTAKLKCVHCGCNFRGAFQKKVDAEGGKMRYWRCAEHNGCDTVGLREDLLKSLTADVLGVAEFDEGLFRERIDHIDILSASEVTFVFKDGTTNSREWVPPKRVGRPWTDEQRAKFQESIKDAYPPERRQQMSEHMKQLRKERGKAWRKEK